MRKFGIGLFAFVLWLSFSAIAQDAGGQQPSDQQQPSASQSPTSPSDQGAASQGQSQPSDQGSMSQGSTSGKKMGKAVHLRGKISDDGKTFTSDKDNSSWTIVNPDAVFQDSKLWSDDVRRQRAAAQGIAVEDLEDFYRKRNLLGVRILPEDVAEAALFLASDRSAKTTGCTLTVDGGVREAFPR